jgi:hypothetical protein
MSQRECKRLQRGNVSPVRVVYDHEHLALDQPSQRLDKGTPDTERFDFNSAPERSQPIRRPLARLRHQLLNQSVGKAGLQLRPTGPQHTEMSCSGKEPVD